MRINIKAVVDVANKSDNHTTTWVSISRDEPFAKWNARTGECSGKEGTPYSTKNNLCLDQFSTGTVIPET